MENKILGLVLATTFLVLLASTFVSATSTLTLGANISTTGFNKLVNFTVTGVYTGVNGNITNCSIWGYSPSTANSSYVILNSTHTGYWVSNKSADGDQKNISVVINTSQLEDSNDYYFKAICANDTSDTHEVNKTSDVLTGALIDNTVPATPTSLDPSTDTTDEDGTVNFTCSVTDARTTGCTLYFSQGNPGAATYAMSNTGTSCSKQLTSIAEQTYRWYCQASDNSNTTDSSSNGVTISESHSAGKIPTLLQQEGVTSAGGAVLSVAGTDKGISFSGFKTWIMSPFPVLGTVWFTLVLSALVVVMIWAFKFKK